MFKYFLIAIQFLTSLSISKNLYCDEKDIAKSTKFFPAVGFLIGLIIVIVYIILHEIFSDEIVAIFLLIILSGISGMQLDGLSDTIDGIYGGRNKEERLKIMKTSCIGNFGAISITFDILIKFLLIYQILKLNIFLIIFLLSLFPTISKLNIVIFMKIFPYARKDGKTKFVQYISYREVIIALFITLIIFFVLSMLFIISDKPFFYFFKFSLILPILFILLYLFSIYVSKKLDGLTGDVYGSINEISEILFLVFCIIFIKYF